MEILSYTDRNWFEQPDEAFWKRRLEEEKLATLRVEEARRDLERRVESLERERDVYRFLAMRWQARMQGPIDASDVDDVADAAAAIFGGLPEGYRADLLLTRRQRAHAQAHVEVDSGDEEESDGEEMVSVASESFSSMEDGGAEESGEEEVFVDAEPMSVSPVETSIRSRNQVRTVSISSHDL